MMKIYKPNSKNTGSCCSFSVTSTGESQGIYVEILKQKSWDEKSKTGSFDATKENKINLKFSNAEIGEIMDILLRKKGSAKFFHTTAAGSSQISFSIWEKDGVIKGFGFSVVKGDKKAMIPLTSGEGFLLFKWFEFALNRIFTADYTAQKEFFKNKKNAE